ncbi:MAG: DNA-binding MarR family transcriptional regulator [Paraglaciecola sp.]|jgi:DNA-binding MarR family transcriptional regulator
MKEEPKIFGAYLDRTVKQIRQNYVRAFKEVGVDITTEQWVLLDNLYQNNGISQNELAERNFKNAPTVSRIIDLLCTKELVERQRFENDRRRYKIFITEYGKTVYEKALPAVLGLRKQGWDNLTEEDYDSLVRIVNQIFENYG